MVWNQAALHQQGAIITGQRRLLLPLHLEIDTVDRGVEVTADEIGAAQLVAGVWFYGKPAQRLIVEAQYRKL
jgi:hypothetical protein